MATKRPSRIVIYGGAFVVLCVLGGVIAVVVGGKASTPASSPTTAAAANRAQAPVVSVVVAIGGSIQGSAGYTTPDGQYNDGESCTANPRTGQWQVVVTNENGTVLGTGRITTLSYGKINSVLCDVRVRIGSLPASSQYGVSVDGSQPVYFSASQAAGSGYQLGVEYGA